MPAPQRRPDPVVIAELLREPQRFGFFQAIRLLDRWLSAGAPGGQGLSRVQFRNSLALSFPPSEIERLSLHRVAMATQMAVGAVGAVGAVAGVPPGAKGGEPTPADLETVDQLLGLSDALSKVLDATPQAVASDDRVAPSVSEVERIELTPAFMGLLGVAGTLPFHYTETLAHREMYQKDFGPRAFMDIFSHRSVMLFYEAWRKHRLPLQFEADRRQRYLPMVLSLAGLGQKGLRDRLGGQRGAVADESLAYFSGALQQRTKSPRQLQQLLQQYLGVPVRVDQFVGRWYALPPEHLPMLGGGGAPAILGRTTTLGERVWQRDMRMRLVLGPLSHQRFQRFLPGGAGAAALRELITLYSGVSLEYEINLQLRQDDVQGCQLDSQRPATLGRLGWDTFLQTRPANDDRADVRYDIHAAA
jgi:type VI secretion system protein ImpH